MSVLLLIITALGAGLFYLLCSPRRLLSFMLSVLILLFALGIISFLLGF